MSSMVDFKKISRNMDIRKMAEQAKVLIDEFLDENKLTDEEKERAWKNILNNVFGHEDSADKVSPSPMTYDEARRYYHNTTIDFGKHKGKKIDEIPFSYLEWLDNQPDFRRDLHRFLTSSFVKSQYYLREEK